MCVTAAHDDTDEPTPSVPEPPPSSELLLAALVAADGTPAFLAALRGILDAGGALDADALVAVARTKGVGGPAAGWTREVAALFGNALRAARK